LPSRRSRSAAAAEPATTGVSVIVTRRNGHQALFPQTKFGGKKRTDITGTPITDLQTDLAAIGYSLHVNRYYDKYMERAVAAFQRHFFSGNRRRAADGRVDQETAQVIKNVIGPK
jgi:N-acetyl-anhydromuramyl-L-alanine amidase AmpD